MEFVSSNSSINDFLKMGKLLDYLEDSSVTNKNKIATLNYNVEIGFLTEVEAKELIEEFIK
jgi:hypothetical protein